jgi:hypothetical protein
LVELGVRRDQARVAFALVEFQRSFDGTTGFDIAGSSSAIAARTLTAATGEIGLAAPQNASIGQALVGRMPAPIKTRRSGFLRTLLQVAWK